MVNDAAAGIALKSKARRDNFMSFISIFPNPKVAVAADPQA
jgi:hypothetical protein